VDATEQILPEEGRYKMNESVRITIRKTYDILLSLVWSVLRPKLLTADRLSLRGGGRSILLNIDFESNNASS
jgi:hypothetical protein